MTSNHRKPLKSAFGLIMRPDRMRSARPSKSLTNLNLNWINKDSKLPDPGSCLFDSSLLKLDLSNQLHHHHRSYSQSHHHHHHPSSLSSPPPPTATRSHIPPTQIITSPSIHLHRVGHHADGGEGSLSTPMTDEKPFDAGHHHHLGYTPTDYHSLDPLSQAHHLSVHEVGHHPTQHESGRLSPTKLALSRLDEIIRGVSTSQPLRSPPSASEPSSSYHSTHTRASNVIKPTSQNLHIPRPSVSSSTPRIGTSITAAVNGLSPPMRRHPHSNGSGSQTPRLLGPAREGATIRTPPTPSPQSGQTKKVLIKPGAWEHISISASEYRYRKDQRVDDTASHLGYDSTMRMDEDDHEGRTGQGVLASPLFSQETLATGSSSKDEDQDWERTMGRYQRSRRKISVGAEDDEEDDDDDGGGEESLVYETSPSSIYTSTPSITSLSVEEC